MAYTIRPLDASVWDAFAELVKAISEVTAGREAQGRFLFSATVKLFEQYGFTLRRPGARHACRSALRSARATLRRWPMCFR